MRANSGAGAVALSVVDSGIGIAPDERAQIFERFAQVGKGARWEVTSRVPLSGALMDTKMVYTLTKLDADSVAADVAIALFAPPNQPMQLAALPPGSSATLSSLSGGGSGKATPSFVHLASTGSTMLSMDSSFGVAMQGESVQMRLQSRIAVTVRPGKAPAKR